MSPKKWFWLSSLALLLGTTPVSAQETRQYVAARERQARSASVTRITRGKVEATLHKISDDFLAERIFNPRHGLFARVGLDAEATGFGIGPAWRSSSQDRSVSLTASAAASATGNWIREIAFSAPDLWPRPNDRVFLELAASQSARAAGNFWGLGRDSGAEGRTTFRAVETNAGGTVGVRIAPWLRTGVGAAHLVPHIRSGGDTAVPPTDDVFADTTAPGLDEQPNFLTTRIFLDVDYRDTTPSTRTAARLDQVPLASASRGGRYQISVASYHDRDLRQFSFVRTTVDLQQHVPLLYGHRVLSLRALAELSDAGTGQRVPFYLSPALGGTTLRGFRTFRFRDTNALLLQAEYRYQINAFASGALFVDAGDVAPRARELSLAQLKTTYGLGLRLGVRGGAAIRADVAFGGERPRLVLGFGHAF